MCWSWEVSLAFFLFDILCAIYLFHRNMYIDRYMLLLVIPIVIQEFCQFVVWKYGIDSNETEPESNCNNINKISFFIICLIVGTIPVSVSYISYATILSNNNKKWIKNIIFKYLFVFESILYFVFKILISFWLYKPEKRKPCIFIGKHGHQIWSYPTFVLLNDDLFGAICAAWYLAPLLALILYKPLWLLLVPSFCALTLYFSLHLFFGPEADSIWCWTGVTIIIWSLCYVPIAKCIINNRLFGRYNLISSTQRHMMEYKVISRSAQLQQEQDVINNYNQTSEEIELISN